LRFGFRPSFPDAPQLDFGEHASCQEIRMESLFGPNGSSFARGMCLHGDQDGHARPGLVGERQGLFPAGVRGRALSL
jgi:hypothetical protein